MAKKQIRHILVETSTKGVKEANAELKKLNAELEEIQDSAKAIGGFLKGPSKALESLYSRAKSASVPLSNIAKNIKSMNTAMAGDSKTAIKNISSYMDNLELVSLSLKDVRKEAEKTSVALGNVNRQSSGVSTNMFNDMLEGITNLNIGIQELVHGVDRQTDAIFDVETQTRKARKTQEKYNQSTNAGTEAARRNTKAQEKMARTGRKSRGTMSELARIGGPLTTVYATLAANVFALSEAFQILNTAQDRARFAEFIRPQLILEYGAALGHAADSFKQYGLAAEDASRKAAKGVTLGLDGEQLGQIAGIAKKASVVLGRDFAESVDRLTLGIAKQERELLDEFGIIVSLTEAQEKYAASIGKTRLQLSSYERQQAFANAVLKEGVAKYEEFETSLTSTEKLLQDIGTAWERISIKMSKVADSKVLSLLTTAPRGFGKASAILFGIDDESAALEAFQQSYAQYNKAIKEGKSAEEITKIGMETARLAEEFKKLTEESEIFFRSTDFRKAEKDSKRFTDQLITFDDQIVKIATNIRISSKSIAEAWEASISTFKKAGPFSTVVTELGEYIKLSAKVANHEKELSETSLKRFHALKATLGLNASEARNIINVFENLNRLALNRDSDINTSTLSIARAEGGGANAEQIAGLRQANLEVEKQRKIVENQKELFKVGKLSTEDLSDAMFALALANAKAAAEGSKLNRIEESARITREEMRKSADLEHSGKAVSSERERVKLAQQALDLQLAILKARMENGEITSQEYNTAKLGLSIDQERLDRRANAAPAADAATLFSSLQGLSGLSQLQQGGLSMAESFSSTFAKAQEAGMGFSEFLKSNSQAFMDFSSSMANAAAGIFQAISEGKVAAIDREIDAEKRRDGQSAKSLAKIKKLEAKKIKEKAKSDKAQIGMSTAVAVMNAYKDLRYPANIAASILVAALGMKQMANVDKAASGQIAGLDAGSSMSSITAGSRSNQIDVSGAANAGEYAFVTGGAGTGTGNAFTPGRASGGTAEANESIMVGERGREMITPRVPVTVTPAGDSAGGTQVVFSPVFHANTVDASGMAELFENYSRELYDGLERELNARNLTLGDLER